MANCNYEECDDPNCVPDDEDEDSYADYDDFYVPYYEDEEYL